MKARQIFLHPPLFKNVTAATLTCYLVCENTHFQDFLCFPKLKEEKLSIFSLATYNSLLFHNFMWFLPLAHLYPGNGQDTALDRLRCLMRKGQQWAGSWEEGSYPRIQKREIWIYWKKWDVWMCIRPLAQGTREIEILAGAPS